MARIGPQKDSDCAGLLGNRVAILSMVLYSVLGQGWPAAVVLSPATGRWRQRFFL
jgi:hypothetical protein